MAAVSASEITLAAHAVRMHTHCCGLSLVALSLFGALSQCRQFAFAAASEKSPSTAALHHWCIPAADLRQFPSASRGQAVEPRE